MKTLRLALLALMAASTLQAGELSVTVKTRAGKTVQGTVQDREFDVKGPKGTIRTRFSDLVSITFGPTEDVVTSRNDVIQKGHVQLEEIRVKVEGSEVPLKRSSLASITFDAPADGGTGVIRAGTAKNGMTWHVRLPKKYEAEKGLPAIVILHGSNMNSKAYVETIVAAWPKLADDYILIGIDGETRVKDSPDDNPACNYTYVDFVGRSKYKGYPGTDRESPGLVPEVIAEIRNDVKITKIFVGGHSQGGFLAYSLLMNSPELFAGAFPISAGLIFQCEPSAYDKADVRAAQRKVAVAIVHAENDPAVDFSMGKSAYESFLDGGFPSVRFFTHPSAGHMFARLPVEEAVRWLEAMTSDDAEALLAFAEKRAGEGSYRDAISAAARAAGLDKGKKLEKRLGALQERVDKAAGETAKRLETAMTGAKDDSWVEEFLRFRIDFEFAAAAHGAMQAYEGLRAKHEAPAEKLWYAAREDFQAEKKTEGYAKLQEIVEKYYASSWHRYAKGWLKERK